MYVEKMNNYNNKPKIIIFSGAGLSAESGISTFRDKDGLWENHKIEDVCNINTWKKNFTLVHDFYNERREQLSKVKPNEAHKTIKRIKEKYNEDCIIITQNVDNLLEKTGLKKDEVLHVHGFLEEIQCTSCGNIYNVGEKKINLGVEKCPKCDSKKALKPNIVFFGENAPMYRYMGRALDYLALEGTILIVIGTNGNVIPIGGFLAGCNNQFEFLMKLSEKENLKKKIKATTILVNLDKSEYLPDSLFDYLYYEKATVALPKIEKIIEKIWKKNN